MQWSKPQQFTVEDANQTPGVKLKEAVKVQEFIIDNRGPGTVFFSSSPEVAQFSGQRIPNGAVWIEDTCAHEGELYITADQANTNVVFMVKA